jgi:predicted thioesterase
MPRHVRGIAHEEIAAYSGSQQHRVCCTTGGITVNHEAISQICFSQRFQVQPPQTAAAVFSKLPFGSRYAGSLAEVLCSAELLAQMESICMESMARHVDWPREVVLGTSMRLDHCGPAPVGATVEVTGFVTTLGDRRVEFLVEARVASRTVAHGTLGFAVVEQAWRERAEQQPAAYAPALN